MKKIFLYAACAALVLSSCSNEILESNDPILAGNSNVTINAYVPGMTRAYEMDEATLTSLQTYGFYLKVDTVNEQTSAAVTLYTDLMTYQLKTWVSATGADLKWPKDATKELQFYALYGGANLTQSNMASFNPQESGSAVISDNYDGETDLMSAYSALSLSESTLGAIDLTFNHVLAQVSVNMTADSSFNGYYYRVGAVRLGAPSTGSYDFAGNTFTRVSTKLKSFALDDYSLSDDSAEFLMDNEIAEGLVIEARKATSMGNLAVVPGDCKLYVSYIIAIEGQDVVPEIKTDSITFTALQGYNNKVNVSLCPTEVGMTFNVDLNSWDELENSTDVTLSDN